MQHLEKPDAEHLEGGPLPSKEEEEGGISASRHE